MARKVRLRGTPAEHTAHAKVLLDIAKTGIRKNTCDSLRGALFQTARALGHSHDGDPDNYDLAWKLHNTAMKKLAKKSCQFTIVRESAGGRTMERVVLRPAKK